MKRFWLHYLEMVIAMLAGMFLLAPVWSWLVPGLADHPVADVMVMATNMSIGMALWMAVRKHPWLRIAEMCAAMYVPFLVLLPAYWMGGLDAHGLMMGGHVLMFPAMLGVMVLRRREYATHH